MDYLSFVQNAIAQDKRNRFAKCSNTLSNVPEEMLCFYRDFDPVDVEVGIKGATVRFIPACELEEVNTEYPQLSNQFIFATSNADPIFLHEGTVYTCPHGVSRAKWEKLAENLEEYLNCC